MNRGFHSGGRLFLGAVPDPDARAKIDRLSGILSHAHGFEGETIKPDRLHVSLLFLGSPVLGSSCDDLVPAVREAVTEVRMPRFDVAFDRTVSFRGKPGKRPFVLVGDNDGSPLKSLRQRLAATLGLNRLVRRDFTPHVTLWYGKSEAGEYPIEPIGWTVSEFLLIHSLRGHTHLACWPLGV
jgi:2'-5' RNA ligase